MSELCHDGVEYKRLKDIATITRGGNFQKKHFTEQGYPCIHYGQIHTYYGVYTHTTLSRVSSEIFSKSRKAQLGDIVMATTSEDVEGVCKCVAWLGDEPAAVSGDAVIIHHNQNAKFMSYFFQSEVFQAQKRPLAYGVKVTRVAPQKLANVLIPVPPLEVQAEIVRILDKWSDAQNGLIALLTRELDLRRQQYAYYRNKLLTFGDNVRTITLGELFSIRNGYTPSKRNPDFWENGSIPWFRMDDIRADGRILSDSMQHVTPDAVKGSLFPANSLIVSTSATIGEHALITADFLANQRFTVLTLKEEYADQFNIMFLYYCCYELGRWCRKNTHKGSFESVDMDKFRLFRFPFPPLELQAKIVRVLNKWGGSHNGLIDLLEAELAARKKQYSYYLDKLLNFHTHIHD